ncbi:MAG: nucleoside recognition domain-containing protein [Candidatus Gastranaerophilaceae bacterium]
MSFQSILNAISLWALPFIIVLILTVGIVKKVPVYEVFTQGAKDGFKVAIMIIPYLVAIIVAISMLRASGAIEMLSAALASVLTRFNIPADVLPVIFVRPLSGSAALGLFSEIATTAGATAYSTKLAAVMVGSSETTFYVLAVYFGSVGITKFRYALWVGILADIIAAVMSIIVCSWMFL